MVSGVVAVGLTGSVGSGKSTALGMLADLGARTFSADDAVHELYRLTEVRAALRDRFGERVFDDSGAVDRPALARLVLRDEQALRWLEALIHPGVKDEMRRLIARCAPGTVAVFEVPLLFDADMGGLFDLTVTIEAARHVRAARVAGSRSATVFEGFDAKQLSSEERVARADLVFVNDGDARELRRFVEAVYRRAVDLARPEMHGAPRDESE